MNLKNIKQPANFPETITCIIEIPEGSKNKYEIDKESGFLKLDRVLYSSMRYPGSYGFMPNSHCEDGDDLDVLVLGQEPIASMALVDVRPIGFISFKDQGLQDDKIISVSLNDPDFEAVYELTDLSKHRYREIENFFKEYKALENKTVDIVGQGGRKETLEVIKQSVLNLHL